MLRIREVMASSQLFCLYNSTAHDSVQYSRLAIFCDKQLLNHPITIWPWSKHTIQPRENEMNWYSPRNAWTMRCATIRLCFLCYSCYVSRVKDDHSREKEKLISAMARGYQGAEGHHLWVSRYKSFQQNNHGRTETKEQNTCLLNSSKTFFRLLRRTVLRRHNAHYSVLQGKQSSPFASSMSSIGQGGYLWGRPW